MNWSYIAGLFDGEGCACVSFKKNGPYWTVTPILFFSGSLNLLEQLKHFLQRENVKAGIYKIPPSRIFPEAKGTYSLSVVRWEGCKRVCSYIWDETIEKRAVIQLLRDAINLHDTCIRRRPIRGKLLTVEDLKTFDRIRHEIHKYARKGPKKLREYTFV